MDGEVGGEWWRCLGLVERQNGGEASGLSSETRLRSRVLERGAEVATVWRRGRSDGVAERKKRRREGERRNHDLRWEEQIGEAKDSISVLDPPRWRKKRGDQRWRSSYSMVETDAHGGGANRREERRPEMEQIGEQSEEERRRRFRRRRGRDEDWRRRGHTGHGLLLTGTLTEMGSGLVCPISYQFGPVLPFRP